jgi:hypothetical protein
MVTFVIWFHIFKDIDTTVGEILSWTLNKIVILFKCRLCWEAQW